MRIIIDTNVFIDSLFHDDKHCLEILNREHRRELSFVISNEMLEEIIKTFFFHARELKWTLEEFKKPFFMLSRLLRRAIDGNIQTDTTFCKDPKDDMFIQCAIDENIEHIISSDIHLLGLKQEIKNKNGKVIKILSPYEFVNEHNLYRLKAIVNSNRI
jgi:putative PIN family toxin of toxin-antitoxin system